MRLALALGMILCALALVAVNAPQLTDQSHSDDTPVAVPRPHDLKTLSHATPDSDGRKPNLGDR